MGHRERPSGSEGLGRCCPPRAGACSLQPLLRALGCAVKREAGRRCLSRSVQLFPRRPHVGPLALVPVIPGWAVPFLEVCVSLCFRVLEEEGTRSCLLLS